MKIHDASKITFDLKAATRYWLACDKQPSSFAPVRVAFRREGRLFSQGRYWQYCLHVLSYLSPGQRSRKQTLVENLGLLATPFGQALRALALTCDDLLSLEIEFARKSTQVFHRLATQPQVNASWVTPINLLLTNEIQDMSALKWVYLRLACTCEETYLSLRKFNLPLLATTCESVWLRLYNSNLIVRIIPCPAMYPDIVVLLFVVLKLWHVAR